MINTLTKLTHVYRHLPMYHKSLLPCYDTSNNIWVLAEKESRADMYLNSRRQANNYNTAPNADSIKYASGI